MTILGHTCRDWYPCLNFFWLSGEQEGWCSWGSVGWKFPSRLCHKLTSSPYARITSFIQEASANASFCSHNFDFFWEKLVMWNAIDNILCLKSEEKEGREKARGKEGWEERRKGGNPISCTCTIGNENRSCGVHFDLTLVIGAQLNALASTGP